MSRRSSMIAFFFRLSAHFDCRALLSLYAIVHNFIYCLQKGNSLFAIESTKSVFCSKIFCFFFISGPRQRRKVTKISRKNSLKSCQFYTALRKDIFHFVHILVFTRCEKNAIEFPIESDTVSVKRMQMTFREYYSCKKNIKKNWNLISFPQNHLKALFSRSSASLEYIK